MFIIGQEVGIMKNPLIVIQTGTIMRITDNKYYVLCRAIFPHQWIVYICNEDELMIQTPYKSSHTLETLNKIFVFGSAYKETDTSYYLREPC